MVVAPAQEKDQPSNRFFSAVGKYSEGVNGVNRLAIKGEKISLTTDKTRKKIPTSNKKIN